MARRWGRSAGGSDEADGGAPAVAVGRAGGLRLAAPGSDEPGPGGRPRLGQLLVSDGTISRQALSDALVAQVESEVRLGAQLVRLGLVDEEQLASALARQLDLGTADLSRQAPDANLSGLLPESTARELVVLPLRRDENGTVEVAAGEPAADLAERLRVTLGEPVRLLVAPAGTVRIAIDRTYQALSGVDRLVGAFSLGEGVRGAGELAKEEAIGSDAPVAQVVTLLITQALRDRASDVHLEPSQSVMRVRFRIDGALQDVRELPAAMAGALVSRVKILAGMNIVERRKPQDGQFTTDVDGRGIDVRVSTMATVWGEKCVLRVLDKRRPLFQLGELGMPADTHHAYGRMARSPFGMVLCAGPTGSGKTTTLYATLSEVDERTRNIVTIEDPVEYVFPSINQIQTSEVGGVGFADGLRAILRQDPDLILVGEIRDMDTARTAVQAALTGHFVLSSLHATDSVAALHRFLDMGIEAFLVASSILGVVSQRLVRRICPSCAVAYEPTAEELAFYEEAGGKPKDEFLRGSGCNVCAQTGYRDRIGVYEFLHMTPEIRRLLVGWATQEELQRMAVKQGMRTLRDEGVSLVSQDVTTISEVIRSIYAL